MPFTSPPPMVAQLQVELLACASWTFGSPAIHYPELTPLPAPPFTLAVLAEDQRRVAPFCEGAAPLISGRLLAIIQSTLAVGVLEALAQQLLFELLAQQVGIPFNASDCGLSSDPSPGMTAGAYAVRAVTLHLPYGLNP